MLRKVTEIQKEIESLREEILDIQNKCAHENYFVGIYSYRPGSYHPNRICKECQALLVGITQEEWDNCLAKFNGSKLG